MKKPEGRASFCSVGNGVVSCGVWCVVGWVEMGKWDNGEATKPWQAGREEGKEDYGTDTDG